MKKFFNSFSLKLVLSLFLIVIVILGSLYFVVNRTTQSEFRDYVVRGRSNQFRGIRESLIDFYRVNGSWEGVEEVFEERVSNQAWGNGKGPGSFGKSSDSGVRNIVLVGPDERVVFSYNEEMIGKKIPRNLVLQGIELESSKERIATLLAGPILSSEMDHSEKQFLEAVNRRIIYAGLIGLIVALLLGWILVRQLTQPLNKLTKATSRVSEGDLDQRVFIESNNELGELADSFNKMTSSLQRSEAIRRRMIGDIAHELRTPLTILSGEIEAIRDGVYEPTDEKLKEIQEDINLLNRLIEDLRELTLAEAGELKLNKGPVNLIRLLKRVSAKFAELLAESDVKLKIYLPEKLQKIDLDADRISQVMNNLIKNAFLHTKRGEISVNLKDRSEDVLIEVSDTGEGIPSDKLDHVFDRFFRADSSRSSEGRSGLGLSIAKELVEAHGGEIWIDSKSGEGTTVSFSLPK